MWIEVKAKHIKQGQPRHIYWCPIAYALMDAGFYSPCVHKTFFSALDPISGCYLIEHVLPLVAQEAIDRLDEDMPIKPFRFEIDD